MESYASSSSSDSTSTGEIEVDKITTRPHQCLRLLFLFLHQHTHKYSGSISLSSLFFVGRRKTKLSSRIQQFASERQSSTIEHLFRRRPDHRSSPMISLITSIFSSHPIGCRAI
ncbi:hypothetical protein QVD17_39340 [Tagetes erecta]|uniref:Uncharacterized protein n=1 Tax=Tagetes erecta TaxID=13708 RepID=A0AAD8NH18_TARER|nr:hypothetical protein QVD17_39340 [Tagetes erecta]